VAKPQQATPDLHPSLRGQSEELIAAMREHSRNYHTPPPRLYVMPMGWPVYPYGIVVAIDGPMVAIRMKDPEEIPEHVEEMIMPISNHRVGEGILGDGVVAGRLGDMLICRYFPNTLRDYGPPEIGNSAHLDHWTREARNQ
jgi:hypothetical protein